MLESAKKAIKNSSKESSVYIGCDSVRFKKEGRWYARYSTVVVLHIDSNRGCSLFYDTVVLPDYGNMKQRLLMEVMNTVNVALELLDSVGDRHLEIHLDLNQNPKHKSNVAVKEALSYVKSMLPYVETRIKPFAFAAAHCADHLARGKKI
jgi:predicted RNase H-related nuclease YkuK (DUF458 family)